VLRDCSASEDGVVCYTGLLCCEDMRDEFSTWPRKENGRESIKLKRWKMSNIRLTFANIERAVCSTCGLQSVWFQKVRVSSSWLDDESSSCSFACFVYERRLCDYAVKLEPVGWTETLERCTSQSPGIAQFRFDMWPRSLRIWYESLIIVHARATHVVPNTRSSGLDTYGALSAY
jgi:hypothetical protein